MNRISKQLIEIASDINKRSGIKLYVEGTGSYIVIPMADSKMDADQAITYILQTDRKLKKGFKELSLYDYCEYYNLQLWDGVLYAYCNINTSGLMDLAIEDGCTNEDQILDYIYEIFNECFPQLPLKINDQNIEKGFAVKKLKQRG